MVGGARIFGGLTSGAACRLCASPRVDPRALKAETIRQLAILPALREQLAVVAMSAQGAAVVATARPGVNRRGENKRDADSDAHNSEGLPYISHDSLSLSQTVHRGCDQGLRAGRWCVRCFGIP